MTNVRIAGTRAEMDSLISELVEKDEYYWAGQVAQAYDNIKGIAELMDVEKTDVSNK